MLSTQRFSQLDESLSSGLWFVSRREKCDALSCCMCACVYMARHVCIALC